MASKLNGKLISLDTGQTANGYLKPQIAGIKRQSEFDIFGSIVSRRQKVFF